MGVLIRKHRGVVIFTGIAKLAVIMLVVSLASSFIDTIWAIYLEGLLKNISLVSFFSAFLTVISFASCFFIIPLVEKHNKSKLFMLSLFFIAISYFLFMINKNLYFFIALASLLTLFTALRASSFGIIIRDRSGKRQLSRNEGIMYTFFNIAWVIGPLIAGYLADAYGIPLVFGISSVFIFLSLIIFRISKINDANIKKRSDTKLLKNFLDFFKNKNRIKAYIISGGANLWWILIYLYMPIYIIQHNLGDIWIGYFLFAVAVPLILFEYPASKLAGRIGFKKMFKIGFLSVAIVSFSCFFISNIYIILGLLVLGSIGISMVEPTTEAYFFDILKTKGEESRYYSIYNTTIDANHFVGKFLAGALLLFTPFKAVFLFFAFFMFLYFLLAFRIKEVKEYMKGMQRGS